MKIVAFDTETKGFDWFDGQTAFLASWADENGSYVADLSDESQTQAFTAALDDADVVVAHNLSFDAHQIKATLGYDLLEKGKELHDTDILARIVVPYGNRKNLGGYKLKQLGVALVDPTAQDAEQEMKDLAKAAGIKMNETGGYYQFWRAYPLEMEKYAAQDAQITYDLFFILKDMLDEQTSRVYELEREVTPLLILAEERGVALDAEAVNELYTEYKQLEKELHEKVTTEIPDEALGGEGSQEALVETLLMLGVPLYRTTPESDKLSTSKFALQEFEDDFPIIADFLEWRRVSKFLSTYLGPMRNREVLHTSFRQCEAWTGRMSSARPNLQNLPKRAGREVRRPLVARPGYSLVACDFDGIEARLLAYYMNDERYKEFFRTGQDPHAWMASEIHGGEPAEFEKGTPGEEKRNSAKNTLFAITYGAGAPRVADMNKIDKAQAKTIIAKIKNSLPKYRKLMGRIRKKISYQGYVTTYYGRKQVVSKDKSYVGLNALIQGTAADVMKQAVVNVMQRFVDWDVHLLLLVHDEVVLEAPTELAEEVARITCEAMAEAGAGIDPPLVASSSIAQNYMEA